ncbi:MULTISPECIES: RNA polymerase sigma factor [unclassified Olleya]|jgi:DNA-directed RNA polymerase specialized sigma24 family protein|uniref:RNA polymerase sigma factor n=1 Tax=unclassified Olleya TaxID=2615019 RepID=UPI00119F6E46|nr:sigma-70 family RNA polymerase sigma factor [Olleya sp. Hel_I_94]TVZ46758.1 DNA-directed RNA polymerase specialized sigma24 family protein [Olleya sp. Hel_I_94]|tara:strand:+ start:203961 stop:204731 length:771 start_codon:yes stop_codon:yes gene_type:complete
MNTNIKYYQSKNEFRLFVKQSHSDLLQFKNEGDKDAFNNLVLKILPVLRNYINRQLNVYISQGHFSKGKYKGDDIIDQLFIEIYDHIEDVKHEKDFYAWLYLKVDQIMEDIKVEEEFNDFFFKNIDTYSKPEWDAMEEKYTKDADGDLLLIEELSDSSYNHNDYELKPIFIEENEVDFINKIDKHLKQDEAKKHTAFVVGNLPNAMRQVFELFTNEHLSFEEIAVVRKLSITEVKKLFNDAKKALQISLFNRYLNN